MLPEHMPHTIHNIGSGFTHHGCSRTDGIPAKIPNHGQIVAVVTHNKNLAIPVTDTHKLADALCFVDVAGCDVNTYAAQMHLNKPFARLCQRCGPRFCNNRIRIAQTDLM